MAGYAPLKMKRKDIDDVNDDFSDFSLSSPARKIRRLDAELPPILEEEELRIPPSYEPSMPIEVGQARVRPVIEEIPTVPENEERAIVLFKPMNTPLLQPPSGFSVSVSPNLISRFKNQGMWSNHSILYERKDDGTKQFENDGARDDSLAVVPWVPSQLPATLGAEDSREAVSESMEAEEMDAVMMDVEDKGLAMESGPGNELGGMNFSDGLHQWQQQHCMIPQPPQQASVPIIWYR